MKYSIDAKGKVPGRIATEVAVLLMGKNRTDFARNKIPDIEVEVSNAGAMSLDAKKMRDKRYSRHSLYPGGLTLESMSHVVEKKGAREVLRRAVYGMLPKNKLRPRMMKNLKINE
ncbi:MAG: 50S ribosomal protein L13 [Candidatus Zambryskibacteria bacterium RIFCSPLOWO2_02_FULL_51_21]|uniref:50S ribosomal protein L13 n=1 Tax=Candidatus Zambryskibacteria bacterium RIFCSPHIGHO2_02_FULL_43_37 TaxID=1802749 RepID=A0A1G2TIP7_9BACT|nr:MAG: 50S ribosomal protein L13 [Candidatus Zambryskibacteria bacterium RIFCSPHIGHO2_01_FULL_52_18]OHA96549.1 MAG: 50S ribosomal protein L13 [Candidatus Zambryskibacteria bacterium RIFCSPHIGHO2_02_FULL_43_37]OHB07534.1 MAG: 50S ribosomal protein L13 [Candidatus Zambryskibacteria bacterium RIFCSPLOWO2_01_FULL_52_12]OHB11187.1 MAG: 50S ribosomal protein L13 [Candidatus Zambryskibacteria bacterium RIFCSPLOWO2_02_FULL_51_21]